jgi:hypothetical protein
MTFSEKSDRAMQWTVTKELEMVAQGGSMQLALELAFLHGAQFVLAENLETIQKKFHNEHDK